MTKILVQYLFFIFFFQAEDGIRDLTMTGVQTCALPILKGCVDADAPDDPAHFFLLLRQAVAEQVDLAAIGNQQSREDRKSTRLNSSHSQISYAVFCLKKKKKKKNKEHISNI